MQFLDSAILGLVEGATEFLPISSTAHLILAGKLLGLDETAAAFEIAMQSGAILAVIFFEWRMILSFLRRDTFFKILVNLIVAFIPAAVVGLILHKFITQHLFSLPVIAATLLVGGIFMLLAEHFFGKKKSVQQADDIRKMRWQQAFSIGCAQVLSIIPGTSRALTTIYGGIFAGLSRKTATEFSFLLAIPVLGAATFYEVVLNQESQLSVDANFWIAFGVSFVVALLALQLFFAFVKKHNFRWFAWYRIALGLGIIAFLYLG